MSHQETASFHLGAMTLPYLRWPLDRALEGIARAGFRHVGLRPGHADGPLLPDRPAADDYRALRRRIDRHGLTPQLMFATRGPGDPAEGLRRDVDTIAALGVPFLLAVPPRPPRSSPASARPGSGRARWPGSRGSRGGSARSSRSRAGRSGAA